MKSASDNIIIYKTGDGQTSVALYEKEGNVWMNQSQLAELFDTSVPNVSMHIKKILKDGEIKEKSVIKNYLTTASDGKDYPVDYYALEMIIAIGFRVRSKRGIEFRQWANNNLQEYMVKGFLMDDERLKNPDGRPDYYDELLKRIRDIRASERKDIVGIVDDDKGLIEFLSEEYHGKVYSFGYENYSGSKTFVIPCKNWEFVYDKILTV